MIYSATHYGEDPLDSSVLNVSRTVVVADVHRVLNQQMVGEMLDKGPKRLEITDDVQNEEIKNFFVGFNATDANFQPLLVVA